MPGDATADAGLCRKNHCQTDSYTVSAVRWEQRGG